MPRPQKSTGGQRRAWVQTWRPRMQWVQSIQTGAQNPPQSPYLEKTVPIFQRRHRGRPARASRTGLFQGRAARKGLAQVDFEADRNEVHAEVGRAQQGRRRKERRAANAVERRIVL